MRAVQLAHPVQPAVHRALLPGLLQPQVHDGHVRAVLERGQAGSRVYFVTDLRDLALPELLRLIARSLGRPARLLPVPVGLVRMLLPAAQVERLVGSLVVDASGIVREAGYHPPFTVEEGLRATAEWYCWARDKAVA